MKYEIIQSIYSMLLSKIYSNRWAVFLAVTPFFALAQNQPSPSVEVVKVAYVNYNSLYKNYTLLDQSNSKWRQEWNKTNVRFKNEWHEIEDDLQKQLKADSLAGGKQREKLLKEAEAKRDSLRASYKNDTNHILNQRSQQVQRYQENIQLALDETVFKGGYTEVKNRDKDTPIKKGNDITDILLQQLNKKL